MKPTAITSLTEVINVLGESVWPASDALLTHCAVQDSEMPFCYSLTSQITPPPHMHTHTHTHKMLCMNLPDEAFLLLQVFLLSII